MRFILALIITCLVTIQVEAQHCQHGALHRIKSSIRHRFKPARVPLRQASALQEDSVSSDQPSCSPTIDAIDASLDTLARDVKKPHRTLTVTVTYTLTTKRHSSTRSPLHKPESSKTRATRSSSKKALSKTTTTSTGAAATVTKDVSSLDYTAKYVEAHNIHRRNHSVPDLVHDAELATSAAKIAATCVYQHDTSTCKSGCGQNIGAGFADTRVSSFVNSMYNNEITKFPGPYGTDNIDTSGFGGWGHYSQIVWKSTTRVGCATQYCSHGLANTGYGISPYFTVCNYYPAGNFAGQWSNVPAPGGGPTVVLVP